MANRENELPSNPLIETALKAIADWISNYRRAIGSFHELGMCGPDEVMRMAKDIGVTSSQLHELVSQGTRRCRSIEEDAGRAARRSESPCRYRPTRQARAAVAVHHL